LNPFNIIVSLTVDVFNPMSQQAMRVLSSFMSNKMPPADAQKLLTLVDRYLSAIRENEPALRTESSAAVEDNTVSKRQRKGASKNDVAARANDVFLNMHVLVEGSNPLKLFVIDETSLVSHALHLLQNRFVTLVLWPHFHSSLLVIVK
jgi:hypothetical protein